MPAPRVAIAHDYLTQRGGAERVVLAMLRAFPDATIYTTLYDPESTYPEFRDAKIVTSPLNWFSHFRQNHRAALPLLVLAAQTVRVEADVMVVSSSGWAHGFHGPAKRLVYCYSPARWLYQTDTYLGEPAANSRKGRALLTLRPMLTSWDKRKAGNADRYLAISEVVRERILETYGIDAEVVPAPHSFDASAEQEVVPELADWDDRGFHLVVSRLLPYKNVDKAILAFHDLDERLVVIGDGPERASLTRSLPENIRLVSGLTDAQMRWSYARCRAVIAPSIEDYGLTPIEAGAYGKPTLALRGGGYLDTVREGVTGLFFDAPVPGAIREAVEANRTHSWDADAIRTEMERFSERHFAERLQSEVAALVQDR
jgi:glycosyltransferase involved in cell wall biosynthesis